LVQADRKTDCAGKALSGSRSFAQALADARAIEGKAGRAAVAAVNSSRDIHPADAELDAAAAQLHNNPVGALAALLAAYGKNAGNATVVRDVGSALAQLGQPMDAIAVFNRADKLTSPVQHPMGISESATELNDRGFALLEQRQWGAAAGYLTRAAALAPKLSEAKLNLAVALMCQNKIPQAVRALAAGARRDTFPRYDVVGGAQIVPPNQIIDVSYGKAGAWPGYIYPETFGDIMRDGKSFTQFYNDESNAFFAVDNQANVLFGRGYAGLTGASFTRVLNLAFAADDSVAGGWAADEVRASAAQQKATDFWKTVMTLNGTASVEEGALVNGGAGCGVNLPIWEQWLTQQTEVFHADTVAWNNALKVEWSAQSKWVSGVLANIANPDLNKAWSLYYDAQKHFNLAPVMQIVGFWEEEAQLLSMYVAGTCGITEGTGQKPPADPRLPFADCPSALKRASFKISFEVFDITVDCEKISVSTQAPALSPFLRVSLARTGDVTLFVGAKAGASLGPSAGKVEAGVYVTIHGATFTDAGVTASAKAVLTAGPVNLTAASLSGTVSFANLSSALTSLVQ
jgi:tetratricopeptide (TPR) repeat protein